MAEEEEEEFAVTLHNMTKSRPPVSANTNMKLTQMAARAKVHFISFHFYSLFHFLFY